MRIRRTIIAPLILTIGTIGSLVAAPAVAALMGETLGWDAARTASELHRVRRQVAAELQAEELTDDAEAHAVVEGAP